MDEVRRFMRYVLPGLVCILELVIADSLTGMKLFGDIWELSKESASVAVGGFLASGALGYIFSNIYFALRSPLGMKNDHKNLLEEIIEEYDCKIVIRKETKLLINKCNSGKIGSLSPRVRWELFNLALHSFHDKSDAMKKFEQEMDRLLDTLHSLGASLFGSVILGLVWLSLQISWYWDKQFYEPFNFILREYLMPQIFVLLCWLLIFLLFGYNFRRMRITIKRFYDSYFMKIFESNRWEWGKTIYYFKD